MAATLDSSSVLSLVYDRLKQTCFTYKETLHYITSNLQAAGYSHVYSSSQISISPVHMAMGLSSYWKRSAICLQLSSNSVVKGKALS